MKRTFIAATSIVGLIILGFFLFQEGYQSQKNPDDLSLFNRPEYIGELFCLPQKENPVTEDCAPGLRTSDGTIFGVYLEGLVSEDVAFGYGPSVRVTGVLVPTTNHRDTGNVGPKRDWARYDIIGIIEADSIGPN